MTVARHIVGLLACFVAFALVRAEPAHACTTEPEIGYAGFSYPFPTTGTIVPRNTKIWIPPQDSDLVETDVVIKAGDAVIATTVSRIVVAGEIDGTVLVFTPNAPLVAGAAITVTVKGQLMSQFTIGADESLSAPSTPVIKRVDVEGAYFGGFSCPVPSHVTVTVASNDGMLVLTTTPVTGVPTNALAMAIGTRAFAVDLAEGEHALQVLAIDAAGNASAPASVPVFSVPTEQSGCAAGARSSSWLCAAFVAVPLALRRRRRR
jgi:hypothetical protein